MLPILTIRRTEDVVYDIPVLLDGVPPPSGIAGWLFWLEVFARGADPATAAPLLAVSSAGGGITVFDAPNSVARAYLPAAQHDALPLGTYFLRARALQPGGEKAVLMEGWLLLSA